MRRLALVLIPLICLASSSAFAVTITVHSSPPFTLDAVNVYATAYQYPSQADAIAAANSFLADGAADSGWGTGVLAETVGIRPSISTSPTRREVGTIVPSCWRARAIRRRETGAVFFRRPLRTGPTTIM